MHVNLTSSMRNVPSPNSFLFLKMQQLKNGTTHGDSKWWPSINMGALLCIHLSRLNLFLRRTRVPRLLTFQRETPEPADRAGALLAERSFIYEAHSH